MQSTREEEGAAKALLASEDLFLKRAERRDRCWGASGCESHCCSSGYCIEERNCFPQGLKDQGTPCTSNLECKSSCCSQSSSLCVLSTKSACSQESSSASWILPVALLFFGSLLLLLVYYFIKKRRHSAKKKTEPVREFHRATIACTDKKDC